MFGWLEGSTDKFSQGCAYISITLLMYSHTTLRQAMLLQRADHTQRYSFSKYSFYKALMIPNGSAQQYPCKRSSHPE